MNLTLQVFKKCLFIQTHELKFELRNLILVCKLNDARDLKFRDEKKFCIQFTWKNQVPWLIPSEISPNHEFYDLKND